MPELIDRRKRRSSDPVVALHYQLEAIRKETSLDALVLADETGCLVAGAGAWPLCEELAGYAPLLESGVDVTRLGTGAPAVVHAFELGGVKALLCAQGPFARKRPQWSKRAANSCQRILRTGVGG